MKISKIFELPPPRQYKWHHLHQEYATSELVQGFTKVPRHTGDQHRPCRHLFHVNILGKEFWRLTGEANTGCYGCYAEKNEREAGVKTLRIQVCSKEVISPTILSWGWDSDHQSCSMEGSGFLGRYQLIPFSCKNESYVITSYASFLSFSINFAELVICIVNPNFCQLVFFFCLFF